MGRFCSLLKVFGITIIGISVLSLAFTGTGTFQHRPYFAGPRSAAAGKCRSG